MSKLKIYIKSILIPLIIGGIIGSIISTSMDYESLIKPTLAPPATIFPIVWGILYILMGISDGILTEKSLKTTTTNSIYYLQLFVNAVWPILFFVLKWRFFAFLWLILLVALIILMIYEFHKKNKISAYLQIPYLIWTLFAGYLNLSIWWLNR